MFALLFAAGDLQVGAGAQAELRAGQAPLLYGESPSNFFMALLTPDADLYWTRAEGESSLRYAPRLLWRDPSPNDQIAPLVLHVFGASHRDRLTRRTELVLRADGSFGEVDYAYLGQTLPEQAALPTATRMLSLRGQRQTGLAGVAADVAAGRVLTAELAHSRLDHGVDRRGEWRHVAASADQNDL